MPRKSNPFNPSEVIARVQTEIICALLRDLPQDGRPVLINKLHRFINPETGLADAFRVNTVRLINYGHDVEMSITRVNDGALEGRAKYFFRKEPETLLIKPTPSYINSVRLLSLVYNEAMTPETVVQFGMMRPELRKGITDSLLLESRTIIYTGKTNKMRTFRLFVCGEVRILWKREIYKSRYQFPDELVDVIRNGKLHEHPDAEVGNNNWYELSVHDADGKLIYSELRDVDVSDMDEEDEKQAVLELLRTLE